MAQSSSTDPVSLLELLSNTLILHQTCPYIPISGLLSLAATCSSFHNLLLNTPGALRYLDLSSVKASVSFNPVDPGGEVWRSERMDEAITEDDFYSGPLRGIFSALIRRSVLKDVQTLILDGLSVPVDLIREIVCEDSFSVRLLSIRGAKNLNERRLNQVLRYAIRIDRPTGTPRLKGLYFFGPMSYSNDKGTPFPESTSTNSAIGMELGIQWNHKSQQALAKDLSSGDGKWYQSSGKMFPRTPGQDWADTLQACEGIIAFDAVLCRGPRHNPDFYNREEDRGFNSYLRPTIASVALGQSGCEICHSSPEGPGIAGNCLLNQVPLLGPLPLHTSSVVAAQKPVSICTLESAFPFFARCSACLWERYCERCHRWWCESCYTRDEEIGTYTELQKVEALENDENLSEKEIKVHLGLCVQSCLVEEMYQQEIWG